MPNQILVNPYPYGQTETARTLELFGTIAFSGSFVATGEPLDWTSLVTGLQYNDYNFAGNGIHGQQFCRVTGIASSASLITFTGANNFVVGSTVYCAGFTTTNGAKVNGYTFTVKTVTAGTSFTASSTLNPGTSGADSGFVYTTNYAQVPEPPAGTLLTAPITAISGDGTTVTVTAANAYLPGARVTFYGGTDPTYLVDVLGATNSQYVVKSSTGTAFTFLSAATGTTDTGFAVGANPPTPFALQVWSALDSGYVYQVNQTYSTLFPLLQSSSSSPLQPIGATTIPAAVLADVVRYRAVFLKG